MRKRIDENQETVDLVNEAGGIKTTITQSDKIGYDWKNFFCNDVLVRQDYVEQENPKGTADNPFVWEREMKLITNGFYLYEEVRKVWTGETGETVEWNDERWEVF